VLKRLSSLLSKAKVTRSRPLKLKKYALYFLASQFNTIYEKGMLVIDRSASIVFVLLYDFWCLLRGRQKKQRHLVEVLICIYKYNGDTDQESIEKRALEDTLVNYMGDRSKISFYYWDVDQPLFGFSIKFYKNVVSLNPKYLVISSYSPGVFYQPMPWLLERLKNKYISIVALWWDTCSDGFAKSISPVLEIVDVHGIIENPTLNFGESPEAQLLKGKAQSLFSPFDFELVERQQDIDVAFLGQVSEYRSVRKTYLDFLLENKVALHYAAYNRNQQCSHDKYYEVLSRSKIGINFSMSVDKYQLKARVFETMWARGLLLEERNEQIAYYFTEDVHYVAFSSEEELLQKINYYLSHESERRVISEAGHKKVSELFSGKQFWDKALGSNVHQHGEGLN